MKWIVQEFRGELSPHERNWQDVRCVPARSDLTVAWDAKDAGAAFQAAVISNPDHRMRATSYRVLPFAGGVTFNLQINCEAEPHEAISSPS